MEDIKSSKLLSIIAESDIKSQAEAEESCGEKLEVRKDSTSTRRPSLSLSSLRIRLMNLLRLQLISSFFPWSSHFSSSEGFVFRY
jgi:hypothetical protein